MKQGFRTEIGAPARVRANRRAWIGLAVLGLPTILLALDLSVVYLALPRLSADLGATSVQQLWITDIYGFVTAGFLVTMGTLGDRIGRRKLLLIGAVCFGVTSVLAAYSTTAGMLIGARAVMGLAGATLMPSTLALITNMFTDARDRATAIAVWTACFMVGAAIGPVVGGALLEHFWWGSLFLLGVPVMVLLLVCAPFLLPEYRDAGAGGLDMVSVGLSLVAVLPIIYAIKALARGGFSIATAAAAAIGLVAGIVFVNRQRSLASPLLDVRLFRNQAFSAALLILMLGIATQGGIMLLVSQHLQIVEGLSPWRAGWALMPASIAMVIGCMLAPFAAHRVRPGWIVAGGLVITAIGYASLARVNGRDDLNAIVFGAILVFFGIGPMAVFSQDLVVSAVPAEKAGSAAALSETSGDFGIALGVAVFGSISNAIYDHRLASLATMLPPDLAAVARSSVAGAMELARHVRAPQSTVVVDAARGAFTEGLRVAAAVSAVVALALAALAGKVLGRRRGGIGRRPPYTPSE